MRMKLKLNLLSFVLAAMFMACSGSTQTEQPDSTEGLDSIEQSLEETIEIIEDETEDMTHDVDSLLEGIWEH